jgi:hypothetical protein
MSRPANGRLNSKRSGASQVALSCDPIVFFEGVPDLVLKFTILCSGQSFCDLVRSWYHVELRSQRCFGVKVHQLANLEFVFGHAEIEPPDGHARRAARQQGKKHRLRLSDAISCGLFLRDVGYWQRERTRSDGQSCTRCSSSPAYCPPGVLSRRQSVTSSSLATSRRRSQSASDVSSFK